MEKKISDIKNELTAADESALPVFVERYGNDERSGVKALVTRAKKRIDKLMPELVVKKLIRYYQQVIDNTVQK